MDCVMNANELSIQNQENEFELKEMTEMFSLFLFNDDWKIIKQRQFIYFLIFSFL